MNAQDGFCRTYTSDDLTLVSGLENRGPLLVVKHRLDSNAPLVQVWVSARIEANPDQWSMAAFDAGIMWIKDDDTVLIEGLPVLTSPAPPGGKTRYSVVVIVV